MARGGVYLEEGTELGGYRIESRLGRGGMGVVYLATHIQLGRKIALKVLSPELAEDEEFRTRFIRESQLAASLDHPNVLPIYDAGEADGEIYLAMRYVEGGDLREQLRAHGRLEPARAAAIARQIALALDAAHRRDLIHRDVKPANILLGANDHVYLADFGLARMATSSTLTRSGMFMGSVDYCAPEQIDGLPLDGRTDIYSLGCVLYHCLAGQPPFARDTDVAVLKAQLFDPPPMLTDLRPDLPDAISAIITIAMSKNPDGRYSRASHFAAALAEAESQLAPPAAADAPPKKEPVSGERPLIAEVPLIPGAPIASAAPEARPAVLEETILRSAAPIAAGPVDEVVTDAPPESVPETAPAAPDLITAAPPADDPPLSLQPAAPDGVAAALARGEAELDDRTRRVIPPVPQAPAAAEPAPRFEVREPAPGGSRRKLVIGAIAVVIVAVAVVLAFVLLSGSKSGAGSPATTATKTATTTAKPATPPRIASVTANAASRGLGLDRRVQLSFTIPASRTRITHVIWTARSSADSRHGTAAVTAGAGAKRTITVGGLANGTAYRFTVMACGKTTCGTASPPSNSVKPYGRPRTPVGRATASGTAITFRWSGGSGNGRPIRSYQISIDGGSWQSVGSRAGSTRTQYGYSQTHRLRVRIVGATGERSNSSRQASATTEAAPAPTHTQPTPSPTQTLTTVSQ